MTGAKQRVFVALTALLPVLFFVVLEGGLRLAGFGDDYPLFIPVPGTTDYQIQNRDVAHRYFAQQQRVPTGIGDAFRVDKEPGAYRIFVQGGSSAAGYPYYFGGSFSRMLAQRLQQTFPDRKIEVVNTSMAAVNSYTLLDFADEIIAEQPDAVLIYAGHNEYYGALGIGLAESIGRFRSIVNLYLGVQHWRTVQLLRRGLSTVAGWFSGREAGEVPGSTLMERMVGEQRIPYGSALYQAGLDQFRGNLRALLDRYRAADIPVYVATVASNERDHKPFLSEPSSDSEAWNRAYREVVAARSIARLDSLNRADPVAADGFFAAGRLLDEALQYPEARVAYVAAKDRDQLRFRAPEALNDIIREEAAATGSVVVDAHASMAGVSRGGIIDSQLMLEHLHPNVDGYFILSDVFYEALRQDGQIGDWSGFIPAESARAELLITAVDSLYGQYRVRQLMGSWPFRAAGTVDRSMDTVTATTPVEAIALDLFRKQISWYEATDQLRVHYEQSGDALRALQSTLALIQQYPFLPAPYAYAGDLMLHLRRPTDALEYYGAAMDREATPMVQTRIADVLLALGRHEDAAIQYEGVAAAQPENTDIALKLGRSYIQMGDTTRAVATLRRLLGARPDFEPAKRIIAALER